MLYVKTQPVAGLQVSVVQTLLSLQVLAVPRHTPQEHVSLIVQALLSVQALPLARFVQLLVLEDGWQLWHTLAGLGAPFA